MKILIGLLTLAFALLAPAVAHAQRVVLSTGHVDAVAPTLRDGGLAVLVKDGAGGGEPVLREPRDVLFHVKPEARMQVPDPVPPGYAFLGAPGSDVWILPQVQDPELLWAGWSSETIPAGVFRDDRLEWTLNGIDGPGPVQLFDQGAFGEPRLFFDSADGLPDTEQRPVGAHAHFNWVFHAPGVYTFNFSVSGERVGGGGTTAYAEYRFFVGALADVPPETLIVDGLEAEYDPGDTVELTAVQLPASRFDDFRWLRTCPDEQEPVEVASGVRYAFSAERSLDGCRLAVVLRDDGGRELLRSDERLLSIRSGTWGPRLIMSRGHADVLNVSLESGALRVAVKDDSGEDPVIRRIEDVLLHAKPQSRFTITEDLPPEFAFLGRPGDTVWLLPEVQQEDILWPGWDTSGVPLGALADDTITWRLLSVEGPGAVQLFTSDLFGLPDIVFNSADGLPDTSSMRASTHAHANWTFSRTGLYKLRFDLAGVPAGGGAPIAGGPLEYWFYVGDLADLPEYPRPDQDPTPAPDDEQPVLTPPAVSTPTPPTQKPQVAGKPSLRVSSARVRGRTLTLATRFGARSRVTVSVRRGRRVVARAKPRTVPPSRRTLRVRLDRRLAPGRYRVRVAAQVGETRIIRTVGLRVRR